MDKDLEDAQESTKDNEITAIQGPMTRGKMRRLQEKVQKELSLLQGQARPIKGPTMYTLFGCQIGPDLLSLQYLALLLGLSKAIGVFILSNPKRSNWVDEGHPHPARDRLLIYNLRKSMSFILTPQRSRLGFAQRNYPQRVINSLFCTLAQRDLISPSKTLHRLADGVTKNHRGSFAHRIKESSSSLEPSSSETSSEDSLALKALDEDLLGIHYKVYNFKVKKILSPTMLDAQPQEDEL
ncbi:hypothetical protein CR513_03154, partial [Mucuna pruriens]